MRSCPFCDAPASRIRIVQKWGTWDGRWHGSGYLRCLCCGARGPKVKYDGDGSDVVFRSPGESVPEKTKAGLALAARAVRAWDAVRERPEDFRLEGDANG